MKSNVFSITSPFIFSLFLALIPFKSINESAIDSSEWHARLVDPTSRDIILTDGILSASQYVGNPVLQLAMLYGSVEPLALTRGDFDEDGIMDLIAGYAHSKKNFVGLYRGRKEAIYNADPGMNGEAPFEAEVRLMEVEDRPEFLASGDFDADGLTDLAYASRQNNRLQWIAGNGNGMFNNIRSLQLDGTVTAMHTGDFNRPDGLTDLALGVTDGSNHRLVLFEGPSGALQETPAPVNLPAAPVGIANGHFDTHYAVDLAVGAGKTLLIISGRDRQLSLPVDVRSESFPGSPRSIHLPAAVSYLSAGDYSGSSLDELALGLEDGSLAVYDSKAGLNLIPVEVPVSKNRNNLQPSMITARFSHFQHDDLAILDPANQRVMLFHEQHLSRTDPSEMMLYPEQQAVPEPMPAPIELVISGTPVALAGMRLNEDVLTDLVMLDRSTGKLGVVRTDPGQVFEVNDVGGRDLTTGDDISRGDGVCETSVSTCTFQAAVTEANFLPGHNLIVFAVDESFDTPVFWGGPLTIDGSSRGRVHIDGFETWQSASDVAVRGIHTGFIRIKGPNSLIENTYFGTVLDGTAADPTILGQLDIQSAETVVGGSSPDAANVMRRLTLTDAHDSRIEGNYVGVDKTGNVSLESSDLAVISTSDRVQVIGNTISGTPSSGVRFYASNGTIQGNMIGTNKSGKEAVGERNSISIEGNGASAIVGGTARGMGNVVVAGDADWGIRLGSNTDSCLVQGNRIGTDITGTRALLNGYSGIDASGTYHTIGGNVLSAGNLIGNQQRIGLSLWGEGPHYVYNNILGTDITGTLDFGNGDGIKTFPNQGAVIGGEQLGNIIANNNKRGIYIAGNNNVISHNRIDHNEWSGIGFQGPTGTENTWSSNSIFDNGWVGISLTSSGQTPRQNDEKDLDGANNNNHYQNYPVLSLVTADSVRALLNSTPNTTFTVEFFGNAECDPSGHGEGKHFLKDVEMTTDAQGNAVYESRFKTGPDQKYITSTATNPDGNSSEYSNCLETQPTVEYLVVQVMQDSVMHTPSPIPNTWFYVGIPDLSDDTEPMPAYHELQSDEAGFLHLDRSVYQPGDPYFIQTIQRVQDSPKGNRDALEKQAFEVWVDNIFVNRAGRLIPDSLAQSEIDTTITYLGHTLIGFDLLVSIEWAAEDAYVSRLETAFRSLSNFLFDVTNGHAYLHAVAVYDDVKYWDDADISIFASNVQWPNARGHGLRQEDGHVKMPPRFFGSKMATINGVYTEHPLVVDDYLHYSTIGHELGHYLFEFRDEYEDLQGNNIYPDSRQNPTQPDILFSFMDDTSDPSATMSSEMSVWVTPEIQQTEHYQYRGMTGWPYFSQQYTDLSGVVRAQIYTPEWRGVPTSGVIAGPTPQDLDVGSWLTFQDQTGAYAGPIPEYRVMDVDGDPVGGVEIKMVKDGRFVNLGKTVLQAGPDEGKIKLLGGTQGNVILGFDEAEGDWLIFHQIVQEMAGKTSVDVILRPISGDYTLLNAASYGVDGRLSLDLMANSAFNSGVTYSVMQEDASEIDLPMQANGTRYTAEIPVLEEPSVLIMLETSDAAWTPFTVPIQLTLVEVSRTENWLLPEKQDLELYLDEGSLSLSQIVVLSSPFPEPTAGLPDNVRRVSPVFSVDAYPKEFPLSGRMDLYYDGDSLLAAVEDAVTIYTWNEDQWEAMNTTAQITEYRQVATTYIEEGGFYAVYLDTTRVTGVGINRPQGRELPERPRLEPNYPNPFREATTIPFVVQTPGRVKVRVFNVLGREVAILADRAFVSGTHELVFDASGRPAGVYFVEVQTPDRVAVRQMVLVR